MTDVIKLFVGCSPNSEDAESQMVLEYSAKKHTTLPIEITWMKISDDPNSIWGGWDTSQWATPFSGFRWAIPEACGFNGKALYTDSDMIILSDLKKLWEQEFRDDPRACVMAKGGEDSWRFCVALWDCYFAKNHVLPIERMKNNPMAHRRMMNYFSQDQDIVQKFKGTWNCIDGENLAIEDIDNLHYSDMSTQFHLKYAIPRLEAMGKKHWFNGKVHDHPRKDLQNLFDQYYNEALTAGYSVEQYYDGKWIDYEKESQYEYGRSFKAHKWSG